MLEEEAKKMEEKLEMVKKMMELEKEKRSQAKKTKDGAIWRSATTQKQIKGYSEMVLTQHRVNQPNLPPTSQILGKENFSSTNNRQGSSNQQTRTNSNPISIQQQQQNVPVQGSQTNNVSAVAANNLNKALKGQSEDFQEVEEFLNTIGLAKYKDTLIDNGVEDLEIILELDEKHLEMMSIPLGHKLKIMKRIKDMRKEKGMTVPESRQGGQRPPQNQENNVEAQSKAYKQNEYESLPEPNQSSGGVGTENNDRKNSPKKAAGTSSGEVQSLLAGDYDEGRSHQEFLDALNAWRNAGKPAETATEDKKSNDKAEKVFNLYNQLLFSLFRKQDSMKTQLNSKHLPQQRKLISLQTSEMIMHGM